MPPVVNAASTWTADLDPHVAPDITRSALIIIDTQADFVDGGSSPVAGTTQVLDGIVRLQHAYRAAGLPIAHVVRLYDGEDVDLPRRTAISRGEPIVRPGTPGCQIVPELRGGTLPRLDAAGLLAGGVQRLGPGEVAVFKPRWSAFHRTPLHAHLTGLGVHTLVFAGCNFPNCPRASIYDASEHDYPVLIASDAISGVEPHHLAEAGRIGVVHAPTTTIVERLRTGTAS